MSTSDRELLELAAKAAGIAGHFVEKTPHDGYPRYSCGMGKSHQHVLLWNPLECDGDALRLAVKLRLEIYFFDGFGEVVAEHNTSSFEAGREQYAEDMNAATRRAIVRAAAEIGRSMP